MGMNIKQFKVYIKAYNDNARQLLGSKKGRAKNLLLLLLSCICIVVTGCSNRPNWLRNRSDDYKTVKECPRLKIPQGMSVDTFSDTYDVPMD